MVFAFPLYDDNPTARAPVVTLALIGLCVGAFLWQLGHSQRLILYSYGMIPAVLFGKAHLAPALDVLPAWATVFTSMFLHGGWLHLIGNMVFLWIFGNNIEDVLGRIRYLLLYLLSGVLLLYLLSGVAAALVQGLSDPGSHVPMIGASGAIAGVLGAYLLLYPRANVYCFVWIVIFFWIISVPAYVLLGLWFAMQLFSGFGAAGKPGVAFWAHVGGFVAGLALVMVLRPSGTGLLQQRRSRAFSATRRRAGGHGSVPSAGRRYDRPPWPWS